MSVAASRRVVVFSIAGTAGIILAGRAARGSAPLPRELFGAAAAFVVIGGLADVAPGLASPLALTVFTTVALTRGPAAIRSLRRGLGAPDAAAMAGGVGSSVAGPPVPGGGGAGCTTLPGGKRMAAKYASEAASIAQTYALAITSGYRSAAQQTATGSAAGQTSDHRCGYAADFAGPVKRMDQLAAWAISQGRFAVVVYRGRWHEPGGASGSWPGHYDHVHISFERCNGLRGCGGQGG